MKIIFSIFCFLGILVSLPIFILMLILGLLIVLPRSKKAYKNYILASVAQSMYIVLAPVGYIYAVFRMNKDGFEHFNLRTAVSVDQNGNVVMQELFNDVLVKDKTKQFGNEDETISSTLGRNYKAVNLSIMGRIIRYSLDKIDKNHCIKSIEREKSK